MAFLLKRKKIEGPGIDLMETVTIGGISQVLNFRGEDVANPVILYLHGGPGFPEMPFLHAYQFPLEASFTLVHWDQRGAGKTFHLNDQAEIQKTLSFERMLADACEVTQYIREKLNKEKIIILGHSWGSILGVGLVQAYPQYFSAYIGVGQVVNMRENERVGFGALLKAAQTKGNKKHIKAIEALTPYPPQETFNESFIPQLLTVRRWQTKYRHATGVQLKTIIPLLTTPYYSWKEKWGFSTDIITYQMPILRFLFDDFDIHNFGTTFEIPVFIIMGDRDYQTPHTLAKEFFEELSAPHKAFFLIPNAAHSPMIDNKTEMNRVLLDEIRPLICER